MQLKDIRANGEYILIDTEGLESGSSSGFSIVDDGQLCVGTVLHAGVKTGLCEFSPTRFDIKVLFRKDKSVEVGQGFSRDIKLVHVEDVLAYVATEKE